MPKLERGRQCCWMPKPDKAPGDFNIMEDMIDRSPPQNRTQERRAADALKELRIMWNIQDQWRHNNPGGRFFTHHYWKNGQIKQERLDRIYAARKHQINLFKWEASPSTTPPDHWIISVKFAPKDSPNIGNGRWMWPLASLNNEPLLDKIVAKGAVVQKKIEELEEMQHKDQVTSPQLVWNEFKKDLQWLIKAEHKNRNHKVLTKVNNL